MSLTKTSAVSTATPPAAATKPDPKVVRLVMVLVVAILAPQLDSTVTNVALNTLSRDFSVSLSAVQWVASAYMLAAAVAIPVVGWASRRLGDKVLWLTAVITFLVASIGSATSWNLASLIAWRVVQGAASGVEIALLTIIMVKLSGGKGLGSLMATLAIPSVIVPVFGPALGGLIIAHASWRWIFWINIPLCLVGAALAAKMLPSAPKDDTHRFDAVGLTLAGAGAACLLYGVSRAGSLGTFATGQVGWFAVVGVALLAGFVWYSTRRVDPAVDVRVFRIGSFSASTIVLAIASFALNGSTLLLPLFWQDVRGATVTIAGLALIPQALGNLATRSIAGKLTDRIGARPVVVVACLVTTAATLPLMRMDAGTSWWVLAAVLFVRGLGLGGIVMPTMAATYFDVPAPQVDSASVVSRMCQNIGSAFGAALAAVLLEWGIAGRHLLPVASFHMVFGVVSALTLVTALVALKLAGQRR